MPLIYRLFAKHFTGVRVDREDFSAYTFRVWKVFCFFFFKVKGLLEMIQAGDL